MCYSRSRRLVVSIVLLVAALGLAACDGSSDPSIHGVSGAVSGLASDESVRLELDGKYPITVSSSGTFTFPVGVSTSAAYSVTVAAQPQGQVCTVTHGSGAATTSNVTNVQIACAMEPFTVSGKLSGLAAGSHVVLEDNGAGALALTANGSFSFVKPVAFNGTYAVTVATEPEDATCTVQHGTGAGVTANVSSIAVTCSPITFTLTGTLNGLVNSMQVTLKNNAADPLTLSADGKFTFSIPVAESGAYNITVGTQPAGQTCSVINGQGTQVTANVANITVTCSTNTYSIGGSVSGLGAGQQVTLEDNGGNALTVMADGSFTFTTHVTYGGAYTVTVGTPPTGLVCLVSNGGGSSLAADVTNVGINCVTNTVSFTTPGIYTWTVPDGLTSISIVATGGGAGGGGMSAANVGQAGGAGAVITGTLSVTPGQVLSLVVGGGGGAGANGPVNGNGFFFGAGGGGGGSSNVDAGSDQQIIAGGGGGAGSYEGGAGGDAGGTGGAGGNGGNAPLFGGTGGGGGSGGIGGVAGSGSGASGASGSNGNGGAGGAGGSNNNNTIPGGSGGSSTGAGVGAGPNQNRPTDGAGGGGGYGGGGSGAILAGGGAGGSTGPAGTTYAPASNGGGSATNGGDGSIVITLQ